MLTRSFNFVDGMSDELERALWGRGVTSWETLRKHRDEASAVLGDKRCRRLLDGIEDAQRALDAEDHAWFAANWPPKDSWRLWRGFCAPDRIAFLDIETTGRTPGYDRITVIGLSNGTHDRAFVADAPMDDDRRLADFLKAIRSFHLLVTFNGVSFDVPFLEAHFRKQHFRVDQPHLDLIYPARALGLSGGLKDMEKQIGIVRAEEIAEIRGHDAIALWGAWKHGDADAYRQLTAYCKADCRNLCEFAEAIYQRKWDATYTPYARDTDLDATMGEQLSLF